MPPTYRVTPISVDQIDRAFPLIHPVARSLTLPAWRNYCNFTIRQNSWGPARENLFVTTNPRGYIQGLCVAEAAEHPVHGHMLDVPIFVVASAADDCGVAGALFDHLKSFSLAQRFSSIRFWTLGEDNWSRYFRDGKFKRWDHGVLMLLDPEAPSAK